MSQEQRNIDLRTLETVRQEIAMIPNSTFVLTGSYALEALTGGPLEHGDMDANVFSTNLPIVRSQLAALHYQIYQNTDTRLEFDVANRRLELGLHNTPVPREIPIVEMSLTDSDNNIFRFQVKSLPYAIATWALRISGAANNQKRAIRQSDVSSFSLLLSCDYKEDEVINIMNQHPQMPSGINGADILHQAINAAKSFK